jgi:hypothetical protein
MLKILRSQLLGKQENAEAKVENSIFLHLCDNHIAVQIHCESESFQSFLSLIGALVIAKI